MNGFTSFFPPAPACATDDAGRPRCGRYTGLIAVSAPNPDELEAAVSKIEQAAIQASCETRRLVGQQAQAFTAAALPLARTV